VEETPVEDAAETVSSVANQSVNVDDADVPPWFDTMEDELDWTQEKLRDAWKESRLKDMRIQELKAVLVGAGLMQGGKLVRNTGIKRARPPGVIGVREASGESL
jgi:hypothetical protein